MSMLDELRAQYESDRQDPYYAKRYVKALELALEEAEAKNDALWDERCESLKERDAARAEITRLEAENAHWGGAAEHQAEPMPLDQWEQHAQYLCRGSALTNAKNQALRVLQLIDRVRALESERDHG